MRDRPLQVSGFKLGEAKAVETGAVTSGGLHEDECDETGGGQVFERFVAAMRAAGSDKARMVEDALSRIGGDLQADLRDGEAGRARSKRIGLWETLKARPGMPPEEEEGTTSAVSGSFSFGFGLDDGDEV